MSTVARSLRCSAAAKRVGVSPKALRLYERQGLISPPRTAAGWRTYGPDEMTRAVEIASLRALGFSLCEVAGLLRRDPDDRRQSLLAHQAKLQEQIRRLVETVQAVGRLQHAPPADEAAVEMFSRRRSPDPSVAFDLPWPWGGERFELQKIGPITFITGSLGCGKTRLAQRLSETLAGAVFLPLDRVADGGAAARAALERDPALRANVDRGLKRLLVSGATASPALLTLLVGLDAPGPVIVDMVEQGLDGATQASLMSHLRNRDACARPLFLMTRSNVILDMASVRAEESVILCPANHSPPFCVAAVPGCPGYEVVVSVVASPRVRARTEGLRAWLPPAA